MNSLNNTHGITIIGTGSSIPEMCITNDDLSHIVDTSDSWITTRTGIKQRRVVGENDSIVSLSVKASLQAIENANIKAEDIGLIILATSTPDDLFGTASKIQAAIGATKCFAFDLTAACSGFLLGFITAAQFLKNGSYKHALVVGADVLSEWVDWSDRTTCVLFGDAAAAVVLEQSENDSIIDFEIHTDGTQSHNLNIKSNKVLKICKKDMFLNKSQYEFLSMNGKEVYKFAISKIPKIIKECLDKNQLTSKDIDWLLLHQANERILEAVAEKLEIDSNKILKNLDKYGNTSAASIPLMLDEALRSKKIKNNDLIVISGFGAGLTWGVTIIKWQQ
uniref:Beta-ketoacyl-[acyl-carrier-protein] synthase III n=1 Tax=Flintiella sanguinaria TaxID=101926 RepID=A0A1X9PUL0_9RHOD|nr:beta-ketoacyl-ACP synthase III [Flintiella sanguinaria]